MDSWWKFKFMLFDQMMKQINIDIFFIIIVILGCYIKYEKYR